MPSLHLQTHGLKRTFLLFLLLGGIAVFGLICPVDALETIAIGKDNPIDWDGSGADFPTLDPEYRAGLNANEIVIGNNPGDLIQFDHPDFPGSLMPRQIQEGENIALGTVERGGTITAPTVLDFTDDFRLPQLIAALQELLTNDAGGELLAFERKNFNALGTLVIIDLGGRFGVNRIRFYPRNTVQRSPSTPFQQDYMRAYELFTNDGINLTKDGNPIWGLFAEDKDNDEDVVDILIDPPQYIRSLRLRSSTPVNFEIDEIEINGTGFLPTARFYSDIIDLGLASWGNIRWTEHAIGDSTKTRLLISTRTGIDETPFAFTRRLADKLDAPEVGTSLTDPDQPLSKEEYYSLPATDTSGVRWVAGSVKDDLVNWSPWSTPYTIEGATEAGTPILSPGPRRYIQFQVLAVSEDIQAARVLDYISLEYLSPPLADQFTAEIFPRQVEVSTATSFTYAVRPSIQTEGLLGFDSFEISTPLRVEKVDRIEILGPEGNTIAEHTFADDDILGEGPFAITSIGDHHFRVRFPLIQEENLLKISFQAVVLVYSTIFNGRAVLSSETGALQDVVPGNSADLDPTDDPTLSGITVFSPSIIKGRLIDAFETTPNPFTPNGDGSNDQMVVEYNVLTLTKPGDVRVRIHDLAGRLIQTLYDGKQRSGRYSYTWDGLTADGTRATPGLYLLQLSVEGDNRQEAQVRPLAVVY